MDKDEVAKRIMDYLQKHPDAGDTLEGIAKWWLQFGRIEETVDKVEDALDGLVKKGKLKKQKVKGRRQIYILCKKGKQEIFPA